MRLLASDIAGRALTFFAPHSTRRMINRIRTVVPLAQMGWPHSAFRACMGARHQARRWLARCHIRRLLQSDRWWWSRRDRRRYWSARHRAIFGAG
jgi:hypothetical protein